MFMHGFRCDRYTCAEHPLGLPRSLSLSPTERVATISLCLDRYLTQGIMYVRMYICTVDMQRYLTMSNRYTSYCSQRLFLGL